MTRLDDVHELAPAPREQSREMLAASAETSASVEDSGRENTASAPREIERRVWYEIEIVYPDGIDRSGLWDTAERAREILVGICGEYPEDGCRVVEVAIVVGEVADD